MATTSFVVIGLGSFGTTVATELTRFGNRVAGVDSDERTVSQLADTLASAIILDATDEGALREAGIDRYDVALVAIGDNLEASILTVMNLKLLGIETIWVKASSKAHHRILAKLGVDRVILPEQEMGRHIAQMLNNPAVQDYVSLGNGYVVVTIAIPEHLSGHELASLGLGETHDLRLLGVMRGTEFRHSAKDALLETDDKLILLGKRGDVRTFGDSL